MKRWTIGPGWAMLAVGALALSVSSPAWAGESKGKSGGDKAEVGSPAPSFELKDARGETHSPSQYTDQGKIVVLHFQSKNCPWDTAYQSHLNEVAQNYAEPDSDEATPVQFLAINANDNESWDELKAYHEKKDMPYPILKDHGHKVADLYKAKTTPHMYVIDTEGVLQYEGGVEKPPTAVSKVYDMEPNYIEPVLDAVTTGSKPPYRSTQEKGCSIKR